MRVRIIEVPSRAHSSGRKESDRTSKTLVSQPAFLPLDSAGASLSACFDMEGSALISLYTASTRSPSTTWVWPDCSITVSTPGRDLIFSFCTASFDTGVTRRRVAQCVMCEMFSGPPRPSRIFSPSSRLFTILP